MNEKENKKRLRQSMALLKIKLENIKPHLETSERLNVQYNKMLIEKAILKNELDNGSNKNNLWSRLTKIVRPRNKKLISDYFHS